MSMAVVLPEVASGTKSAAVRTAGSYEPTQPWAASRATRSSRSR